MRYVVGIILGALSALLICGMAFMFFVSDLSAAAAGFVFLFLFVGGWIASSWVMIRETRTVWRVLTRGSLIGAAEWLMIVPARMVLAAREAAPGSGAAGIETQLQYGGSPITVEVAVAMAVVCLLVFAIAYFLRRELQVEE